MPRSQTQTCLKKIVPPCIMVGTVVFIIIFLTSRENDAETEDKDAPLQDVTRDPGDPGDPGTYDDCRSEATVVVDEHITHERDAVKSQAWKTAEQNAKEPAHQYMKKEHSTAVYMYTNSTLLPVNQDFKTTARTGEQTQEVETVKRRSLYFYLSEAIQILKHSQVSCLHAYHTTETSLSQNISVKQVRFSAFTLSSLYRNINSSRSASCFEIDTCFGADITHYSASTQRGQVLIPPYEVFKVTGVQTDARLCEIVYNLKSNMDCVYDRESDTLHPISAMPVTSIIIIIVSAIIASLLMLIVIVKVFKNRKLVEFYSVSAMNNDIYLSAGVDV